MTLLSIKEASRLMGVCENTLREWDEQGTFKAQRTIGGHRRYHLDAIRVYLEKNVPEATEEVPTETNENENDNATKYRKEAERCRQKWSEDGYIPEDLPLAEQEHLSVILENVYLGKINCWSMSNPVELDDVLWLAKEAWLRSKLRKFINIQPMIGPCDLIYYFDEDGILTEDSVAAITHRFDLNYFCKGDFTVLKDIYADSLAYEIDMFIYQKLLQDQTSDEETFLASIEKCKYIHNHYQVIICREEFVDKIKDLAVCSGATIITTSGILNKDSFRIAFGAYTREQLSKCFFLPYVMLFEAPKSAYGPYLAFTCRAGIFKVGKKEKKKKTFRSWNDNDLDVAEKFSDLS